MLTNLPNVISDNSNSSNLFEPMFSIITQNCNFNKNNEFFKEQTQARITEK